MSLNRIFKTSAVFFIALFIFTPVSYSGFPVPESDSVGSSDILIYFFDLRDRESFIQLTNVDDDAATVHIQIWDVSNNCNENDFFDTYTPADTHIYNMRDIQTNDGNPSGVVLPEGAYGFVSTIIEDDSRALVGNFRVVDNAGYEYRTNAANVFSEGCCWGQFSPNITFNYNTEGNVTLSDVIGIPFNLFHGAIEELVVADITETYAPFDIDIYDLNEVPFSCRNVIFACTDQDSPLYEALLEQSGDANVASFEYGINNAIPHSRNSELLCPGNVVSNGFVTLNLITDPISGFVGYIGLNNGNGRGSMDSFWFNSDNGEQPVG